MLFLIPRHPPQKAKFKEMPFLPKPLVEALVFSSAKYSAPGLHWIVVGFNGFAKQQRQVCIKPFFFNLRTIMLRKVAGRMRMVLSKVRGALPIIL